MTHSYLFSFFLQILLVLPATLVWMITPGWPTHVLLVLPATSVWMITPRWPTNVLLVLPATLVWMITPGWPTQVLLVLPATLVWMITPGRPTYVKQVLPELTNWFRMNAYHWMTHLYLTGITSYMYFSMTDYPGWPTHILMALSATLVWMITPRWPIHIFSFFVKSYWYYQLL